MLNMQCRSAINVCFPFRHQLQAATGTCQFGLAVYPGLVCPRAGLQCHRRGPGWPDLRCSNGRLAKPHVTEVLI